MKIREHCLSQGKRENFIPGSERESSPLTKTGYKLPQLRHTDWSCCEFWIKKVFPLLCQTTIKNYSSLPLHQENNKYWQRCCFRVSSNCSFNPLPYSWDYFQNRKKRRKTVIHSQNMFTGRVKLWVSHVQNIQGFWHLLDFLCCHHCNKVSSFTKLKDARLLGCKDGPPPSDKFD